MSKQGLNVSLEFAIGAVTYLEAFTGKKLNDQDTKLWTERLQKYPEWKLLKLDEYSGPMNNGVFKFLDELQTVREDMVYKQLEETRTPMHIQMARDFNDHIQKVMNFTGSREERIKWEMESFSNLDKSYPHLGVWDKVKGEKRFQEFCSERQLGGEK